MGKKEREKGNIRDGLRQEGGGKDGKYNGWIKGC